MSEEKKPGKEWTNQELEEALGATIHRAIRLATVAEQRLCDAADSGLTWAELANADMTEAVGYLKLAKASATRSGHAVPDVSVRFGGK